MMEPTEKKSLNIGGLIVLFIVFAVVGTILSYLYLGLVCVIASVYPIIILAGVFGALMYGVVYWTKSTFKITNRVGTVIVVILASIVVNYFKWQIFFGVWHVRFWGYDLSFWQLRYVLESLEFMIRYPFEFDSNPIREFIVDLRYFNYHGTWSLSDSNVTGITLWAIWAGELVIIFGIPLMAAIKILGIMLPGQRKFALPQYLMYSFEPFTEEQADSLISNFSDINTIVNQPLTDGQLTLTTDQHGTRINNNEPGEIGLVAHLHIGDTPTEYILLTNTKIKSWPLDEVIGKWFAPIPLGVEKIETLMQELAKKYDEPEPEPDEDLEADSDVDVDLNEVDSNEDSYEDPDRDSIEENNQTGEEQ